MDRNFLITIVVPEIQHNILSKVSNHKGYRSIPEMLQDIIDSTITPEVNEIYSFKSELEMK